MNLTAQQWAQCVLILRSVYKTTFRLDAADLDIWYRMLCDLPGDHVQAAVMHMARTTEAFPSIAEIRKWAEAGSSGDSTAAWGEFIVAVSRYGYTNTPIWTDPRMEKVVHSLGGWQHICQTMLVEDEPTWRAQFRRAYEAIAERDRRDRTFAALGIAGPQAPQLPEGA